MTRANGRGRKVPRIPQADQPEPDTQAGRDIGMSARQDPAGSPIPGLTGNIVNYETVRQVVPIGEPFDEYRGMMAHGVPNASESTEERATMERSGSLAQHRPPSPPTLGRDVIKPAPIPVYITTLNAGGRPLGSMSTRKIAVPAAGLDPVRIAARDRERTEMKIFVETAAGAAGAPPTGIRIDPQINNLSAGFGALVPAGNSSYLSLDDQQDEVFAISNDGSACTISVIYLYGESAAG